MRFSSWLAPIAAIAVCAPGASTARADWSIILVDTRTGEVGVAGATCVTNMDLKARSAVLLPELGAGIVRPEADTYVANRTFLRDRMLEGLAPADIIAGLASFESRLHSQSQYGIVTVTASAASHSGNGVPQWKGGQTGAFDADYAGQIGTIQYSIQGLALAGEPVVLSAIEAAIATESDLPGRLMASMEAARAFGGDGRCSCSTSNPSSCGSPPPPFTKAAHAAYMLVARTGDQGLSVGSYKLSTPRWITSADFNADGRLDVAAAVPGASSVFLNTSQPHRPVPTLVSTPRTLAGVEQPDTWWVGAADVTGDGRPDIVQVLGSIYNKLRVRPGNGDGTFGPAIDTPIPGSAWRAVIGNFDGNEPLDIAVARETGTSILLGTGGGQFVRSDINEVGRWIVAADFDADGDLDLLIGDRGPGERLGLHLNNGKGVFTPAGDLIIAPGQFPVSARFAAGDFDGDHDQDVAVVYQASNTLYFFRNDGGAPPTFTLTPIALPYVANFLASGDINRDGVDDLYIVGASSSSTVVRGGPDGLTVQDEYQHPSFASASCCALIDVDSDGDLDALLGFESGLGNAIMIVPNLGPDTDYAYLNGSGLALGSTFMDFNVAFQGAADPDPIPQIRGTFDLRRTNLLGRPDAVQSLVDVPLHMRTADPTPRTLTITLRDWQGTPIAAPVSLPTLTLAPGSPGATAAGPVTDLGAGVYTVSLAATGIAGTDRYEIRVDDGVRPVILMPRTVVTVSICPSDVNADGVANSTDVSDFVNHWFEDQQAGTLTADYNGDGVVNSTDVCDLINAWFVDLDAGLCV